MQLPVAAALKIASSEHNVSTESLSTAHERYMAHFRDAVKDNSLKIESAGSDLIAPSSEIQKLLLEEPEQEVWHLSTTPCSKVQ